jgi:hypothetical protein
MVTTEPLAAPVATPARYDNLPFDNVSEALVNVADSKSTILGALTKKRKLA